jgi:hypothetical protein
MTDKAKLESLLTALRAAQKGSRELDAQIEIVCFGGDQTCPNAQSWTFYLVERRSSSLDAAAAFRERMRLNIELTDPQAVQDFIDESPERHSVYILTRAELHEALVQYIEREMAREKFDPDASLLFHIDDAETLVAVKRSVRQQ